MQDSPAYLWLSLRSQAPFNAFRPQPLSPVPFLALRKMQSLGDSAM